MFLSGSPAPIPRSLAYYIHLVYRLLEVHNCYRLIEAHNYRLLEDHNLSLTIARVKPAIDLFGNR